jgi:DNA-binding response OmpR family regulator
MAIVGESKDEGFLQRIREWAGGTARRLFRRHRPAGKRGATMDERWRILVVDDDQDVLDLIRLKLAPDYDVLCIDKANDVGQAADLFEPDLIILDIMLPKISGYQVLEYLKRNPMTAKTPVCFLSAKSSARDLKYGYSLGASLYLTKPFQPERLIRNVKLQFERMPPPLHRKRHTIEEINKKLSADHGPYQVATAQAATAGETAKREKVATPPPATPPPPEEDEDTRPRAHWVH